MAGTLLEEKVATVKKRRVMIEASRIESQKDLIMNKEEVVMGIVNQEKALTAIKMISEVETKVLTELETKNMAGREERTMITEIPTKGKQEMMGDMIEKRLKIITEEALMMVDPVALINQENMNKEETLKKEGKEQATTETEIMIKEKTLIKNEMTMINQKIMIEEKINMIKERTTRGKDPMKKSNKTPEETMIVTTEEEIMIEVEIMTRKVPTKEGTKAMTVKETMTVEVVEEEKEIMMVETIGGEEKMMVETIGGEEKMMVETIGVEEKINMKTAETEARRNINPETMIKAITARTETEAVTVRAPGMETEVVIANLVEIESVAVIVTVNIAETEAGIVAETGTTDGTIVNMTNMIRIKMTNLDMTVLKTKTSKMKTGKMEIKTRQNQRGAGGQYLEKKKRASHKMWIYVKDFLVPVNLM